MGNVAVIDADVRLNLAELGYGGGGGDGKKMLSRGFWTQHFFL